MTFTSDVVQLFVLSETEALHYFCILNINWDIKSFDYELLFACTLKMFSHPNYITKFP